MYYGMEGGGESNFISLSVRHCFLLPLLYDAARLLRFIAAIKTSGCKRASRSHFLRDYDTLMRISFAPENWTLSSPLSGDVSVPVCLCRRGRKMSVPEPRPTENEGFFLFGWGLDRHPISGGWVNVP